MSIHDIVQTTKIVPKSKTATKFERDCIRFNFVRTQFCSTNRLKPKEKELLHLLETRSECNNGDTKINNESIGKVIGRSRQSIDRYLKTLEDLGFICRLTVAFSHNHGGEIKIWKERVLRCRRIFLKNRFNPKTKEDLKWKRDIRPPFDVTKTLDESTGDRLDGRWLVTEFMDITLMDGTKVKPKWTWYPDLYEMGLLDIEQTAMYEKLKDLKEVDNENPEATLVLGVKYLYAI